MPTPTSINPKTMTDEQLAAVISVAQAEQAERDRVTREYKAFLANSAGRMTSMQARFAAATAAPANGNAAKAVAAGKAAVQAQSTGKPKSKSKRKGKRIIAERGKIYRDPETKKEWRGFGPMPGWLKSRIAAGAPLESFTTAQG
jgi:DNA-binding protein H-NS